LIWIDSISPFLDSLTTMSRFSTSAYISDNTRVSLALDRDADLGWLADPAVMLDSGFVFIAPVFDIRIRSPFWSV
jgi:hypothetical protein